MILHLLLVLLTPVVFAANLKSSTVKITSAFKDGTAIFHGSGLALSAGGEGYVLTSDHVVLHDNNDDKTHSISTADGHSLPCDFVAADFARGLALLHVKSGAPVNDFLPLDQLRVAPAQVGDPVRMLGYPAMAAGLVNDGRGRVADPTVSSNLLVDIPALIEIDKGHAEFGMSGGVIASATGSDFLALLAYQKYADQDGPHNIIYGIPALVAVAWVKQTLRDPDLVELVQNTAELMDPVDPAFASGQLNFYYLDPYSNGHKMVVILPASQRRSSLYARGGDLSKYETFLVTNTDCQIQVLGFRNRGDVQSFHGAGDRVGTMRAFANMALEAETQLWCNESDHAAETLPLLIAAVTRRVTAIDNPQAAHLLAKISAYLQAMDEGKVYTVIKPADFAALRNSSAFFPAWKSLEETGQDISLRADLDALMDALKFLTI